MSIQVRSGQDWTFEGLHQIYDEIDAIAKDMGYTYYNNQIEVITSEQMMDAYASIGMPIMYNHWSFGKSFVATRDAYHAGYRGLAYEIVINSDPCISYIMEENDMMMQTLVIAHAAIGHNSFFKNNYLFKDWTQANYIIEYLEYSKKYIAACEEKFGLIEVEKVLDAAHALMTNGVFRFKHKEPLSFKKELERQVNRAKQEEQDYNVIWRTIPKKAQKGVDGLSERQQKLQLPEGNLIYFLEKYSPILKGWQREILRIVRNIAQYFYPQSQTKIMNEGCATWTHYTIMNKLFDKGIMHEGAMIEFLKSHCGVTMQPPFYHPFYSGLNPYAIGFKMMEDICRICDDPTDEDREWFPNFAGNKDSFNVLKDAWANYRDESFIRQYLSPKVMRDMKLFTLYNNSNNDHYKVTNIHNENGYRNIREILANENTLANIVPNVEVFDVDLTGDRELKLHLNILDDKKLDIKDGGLVCKHIANLWGYPVRLVTHNKSGDVQDAIYRGPDETANQPAEVDYSDYIYC